MFKITNNNNNHGNDVMNMAIMAPKIYLSNHNEKKIESLADLNDHAADINANINTSNHNNTNLSKRAPSCDTTNKNIAILILVTTVMAATMTTIVASQNTRCIKTRSMMKKEKQGSGSKKTQNAEIDSNFKKKEQN